jgi:uncharacterized membrane protein
VIVKGMNIENFLSESFTQIRNNADGNVAIILRVLDSLQTLAGLTSNPQRRRALIEQVELIAELVECSVETINDCARIETSLMQVREKLDTEPI